MTTQERAGWLGRLRNWALYKEWRTSWRAVWFHLGRAVMLSAASEHLGTLNRQPVNDRGKTYAREAYLSLTGKLDQ